MNVTFVPMAGALTAPRFAPRGQFAIWAREISVPSAVPEGGSTDRTPSRAPWATQFVSGVVPSTWCAPSAVCGSGWGGEGFSLFGAPPLRSVSAVYFLDRQG